MDDDSLCYRPLDRISDVDVDCMITDCTMMIGVLQDMRIEKSVLGETRSKAMTLVASPEIVHLFTHLTNTSSCNALSIIQHPRFYA